MDPNRPADAGETLILGGGLAGLACAHALDAGRAPWRLLEAEAAVGGLARSETRDGFVFDATGHWLHLRDPWARALVDDLLGEDALWVERSAWIHVAGAWVPYPFQTNVWALPPEARYACLSGFVEARFGEGGAALRAREARTFREYVLKSLGEGIARLFMLPYNEKLWTVDLGELSPAWTGRFVPNPSVEDVLRGAVGAPTELAGYNARFVYPREGGIGVLPRRLAARLEGPVHLSTPAVSVDTGARVVRTADGAARPYRHLVSTMPLPRLVALCEDAPAEVKDAAAGLRATSVTYVNVAVKVGAGTAPLPYHWVYFPEPEYPFYRAGCASAAVPSLAPAGHRSFYVEFSHRGPADLPRCEADAVAGLKRAGLIRPEDEVRFAFARTLPVAYVLFDHEHEARRRTALDWLASRGVQSVGRYGAWEYSSMEDALLEGRDAGRRILEEG